MCTLELTLGNSIPNVKRASIGPAVKLQNATLRAKMPPICSTTKTRRVHTVPVTTTINFNVLLADFSEVPAGIIFTMKSS